MANTDSNKRFGLIGLALIILAFITWAFILPRFDDKPPAADLDAITAPSAAPQAAPQRPVTETPKPPRPTGP